MWCRSETKPHPANAVAIAAILKRHFTYSEAIVFGIKVIRQIYCFAPERFLLWDFMCGMKSCWQQWKVSREMSALHNQHRK